MSSKTCTYNAALQPALQQSGRHYSKQLRPFPISFRSSFTVGAFLITTSISTERDVSDAGSALIVVNKAACLFRHHNSNKVSGWQHRATVRQHRALWGCHRCAAALCRTNRPFTRPRSNQLSHPVTFHNQPKLLFSSHVSTQTGYACKQPGMCQFARHHTSRRCLS